MSAYIENFKKYKPLLSELAVRDIKTRYRRSALGVLWSLLNPLCQMVVLLRNNIENFPHYILSGQVIYNFLSESTNSALTAIIGSASLIKKAYIPKYLFVLSRILSSAVNVMATFAALMVVMLVTRAEFHYTMILAIIPLIFVILFSSGVGLILAAYAVKFRDIIHLYGVFVMALMYMTPIIYPMSMNPLTNMVLMFRDLALYGIMPGPMSFVVALIECAVVILIGLYVFYKKQDTFILNL